MSRGAGRAIRLAAVLAVALGALPAGVARAQDTPPIHHVWVLVLENSSYNKLTGNSPFQTPGYSPYLSGVLTKQGNLLTQYWGIGHNSLDNYMAMVSGQAPNPDSQGDCLSGADWVPPNPVADLHGQFVGQGCFFPPQVKTLADQLDEQGLTWKGYMQDYRDSTQLDGATCPATAGNNPTGVDQYIRKHDPWQWFHSLIDDGSCQANDLPLSELAGDLQSVGTTPNFSFISPGLFDDGHDGSFPGQVDPFLREIVPMILDSPAYKRDGLLIVTFDESEVLIGVPLGPEDDMACCNEIPGPNSPMPGISGPGGGRVGAVALSPYIQPGSVTETPYNHYSFLRSMEDVFGIDSGGDDGAGHLGFAGSYLDYPGPGAFGDDVYTGWDGSPNPPAPSTDAPTGPRPSDGTAVWQHPRPQGDELNGVSCAAGSCFAVGQAGVILKSSDGGASWAAQDSGTAAALNAISCASAAGCVAVGPSGVVLRTSDGGASWSSGTAGVQTALNGVDCPSATVCAVVGAGGTILRTTDGGATWSAQTSGTQKALYGVDCPAADVCFAGGLDGTMRATTDGSTWNAQSLGVSMTQRIWAVSCASASECYAAGDTGTLARTTDGGANWSTTGSVSDRYQGLSCPATQTCFVAGESGRSQGQQSVDAAAILKSTNGGVNYGRLATASDNILRAISCAAAVECVAVGARGSILRTTDGATWSKRSPGTEDDLTELVCTGIRQCLPESLGGLDGADCPDEDTCYAVGSDQTIMKTGNGGSTWTIQRSFVPPDLAGFVDPSIPPPGLNSISCPTAARCFAVGDHATCPPSSTCAAGGDFEGVWTTSDGGANWTSRDPGVSRNLLGISCPTAVSCVAVGADGTIVRSNNGGGSWGLQPLASRALLSDVSCDDLMHCVAVGAGGATVHTSDGGAHWTYVSAGTPGYLDGVSCPTAKTCLAVGEAGTVLRSGDGGESWSPQDSGVGDDLRSVSCPSSGSCMAVGSRGTVISTADGGDSWAVQGTGTARALRAVSCAALESCIAAGDAGAILGVSRAALPEISIEDRSVVEGNTGTVDGAFTISLSSPISRVVKVDYRTSDGSAGAPADYASLGPATLSFDPMQLEKAVTVPIVGDLDDEPDETFTLDLSNPVNASLGRVAATGTILDDDAPGGGVGSYEDCPNLITGTAKGDKLEGASGDDRIRGHAGDDTIRGHDGDDCLSGQRGEDRVGGGSGADLVKGGRGRDRLSGGSGNDLIRARHGGRDRVNCGAGHDVAFVNRGRDRVGRNCEKLRF